MGDVIFPLCIAGIICFGIWATMVQPNQARERIVMQALEIYKLELEAKITKDNSLALPMLRELGAEEKIKEQDHGNDQR